jgi:hypothetical protein
VDKLLLILTLLASTTHAVVNPTGKTHTSESLVTCADGKKWTVCGPGNTPTTSGDPVIAFSDLTYAANSGWSSAEPTKGAVVTIWGRNFGTTDSRGSDYVTVNGTNLTASVDYVDTWAETNNPVPYLQSITFQLNNTISSGVGTISVTVGGDTSNTVPFEIGAGSIYFVDDTAPSSGTDGSITNPFDCTDYVGSLSAGDVVYWRGGTYQSQCHGGNSVIWYKDSYPAGVAGRPISLIAYPNEDTYLDGVTNGHNQNFNKGVKLEQAYVNVHKFRIAALEAALHANDYTRFVGNDAIGTTVFVGGSGIINLGGEESTALGNHVHGGRSGDKLDHAIYLQGCSSTGLGQVAAYNQIDDNELGALSGVENPGFAGMIIINHHESRCAGNEQLKAPRIYNNLISCENYFARGIGVNDLSWDVSDTAGEPEPALVYNNIMVNCGVPDSYSGGGDLASIYHDNGHAVFFNNTIVNTRGLAMENGGGALNLETHFVNNMITSSGEETVCLDSTPEVFTHNSYHGCGALGSNSVTGNPLITVDTTAYNPLTVGAGSPLIDAANDSVESVTIDGNTYTDIVTRDFYLNPRPSVGKDIGAVEVIN